MSNSAVRLIPPPAVTVATPVCEAKRTTVYHSDRYEWMQEPKNQKRCRIKSAYLINGKHLCVNHARVVALDLLLKDTDAKVGV